MRPVDADKYKKILERLAEHLENQGNPKLAEVARTAANGLDTMPTIKAEELARESDCGPGCARYPSCEYNHGARGVVRINCPLWRPRG